MKAKEKFSEKGCETELVDLVKQLPAPMREEAEKAWVLVVRGGIKAFVSPDALKAEQKKLTPDTKFYHARQKKVMNKHARYNLCFAPEGHVSDYEKGLGTVISYKDVPLLSSIRDQLQDYVGEKARELQCEGNYYFDVTKCGIGFHGDGERKRVIGLRLGATIPLHYQWFQRSKPVGQRFILNLNHGDLYIMSEKAVGFDWLLKKKLTLRHAAGSKKYTTIKEKE